MGTNRVLFEGNGTTHSTGLWVTDGTSAGTWEIATADPSFNTSTDPQFLVSLGSHVIFSAHDLHSSNSVLWVSDGTSPGTFELSVTGASTSSFFPRPLVLFN